MELGLLLIFWYGILHAFGPDHLTAIADFSIGKSKKKTLLITIAFAVGHGIMLFLFAKILQYYSLPEYITNYGDIISSVVILSMGLYILFMVFSNRIQLKVHNHQGKDHIHIWFGKNHEHDNTATASAFTIGALMGIGGVRGMLVTLGLIEGQSVDFILILMFVLGVSVVFVSLGVIILYINKNLLNNLQNIRKVFTTVGIISVIVGANMLFTPHSHAVIIEPNIQGIENHSHPHPLNGELNNADALVQSKAKSDMTYKQMMQRMGEAYKMMQTGIINQNKELVKMGIWMIDNHPAPKEKPWSIVKEKDKESFKKTLIAYNNLLHSSSNTINKSLNSDDWVEINKKVFELSNHCLSCHHLWKNNLK
jgi:ABC-type nickel/cobalt efflux system permease component RcnA